MEIVKKVKTELELPEDVVKIIRAYSRPLWTILTRDDWRTCKRNESRRIKGSNKALILWYKYQFGPEITEELMEWTFYGRRHLIWSSKRGYWMDGLFVEPPLDNDPNWYKQQFVWLVQTDLLLIQHRPVELVMYKVSLIV
jgi:hypothetical protein